MSFLWIAELAIVITIIYAEGPDNQGREFILGFMENEGTSNDLEMFVTTISNTPAEVNITTPLADPSFFKTTNVSRGTIEKITLPNSLRTSGIALQNKGVLVTSTQEITLYGVNKESHSTDGFVAIPTDALGMEYVAVTYLNEAIILIVGTMNDTSVSITFRTGGSSISVSYEGTTYTNGDTLNVTLGQYETFNIYEDNGDFTCTRIVSDKAVTVFSGNKKIPIGPGGSADHVVEQLTPTQSWGKNFIFIHTPDRSSGDYFRIIAKEPTIISTITLGNHTLQAYEYLELDVPSAKYETVTSDNAVLVAMFGKTFANDGSSGGDPHMSILPPVPQFTAEYTWSTIQTPTGEFTNYLVVVIENSARESLFLDNVQISNTTVWTNIDGSSLVTTTFDVSPGSHSLYHSNTLSTFLGIAFGNAGANSYAYAAGFRLASINAPCSPTSSVAGDIVDNDCDGFVDEEQENGIDDDGDGQIDEDLAPGARVDGGWSEWGSWSCSLTCGNTTGTETRTRTCTNPEPANNGLDCEGSSTESQACVVSNPCPVPGGWSDWQSWASCSVTCGPGTRTRTRLCDNPVPQYGGTCTGSTTETECCWQGSCYPSLLGNLERGCSGIQFGCVTGSTACVSYNKRCDGTNDCDDGSDESVSQAFCISFDNKGHIQDSKNWRYLAAIVLLLYWTSQP